MAAGDTRNSRRTLETMFSVRSVQREVVIVIESWMMVVQRVDS
jgi:hypothetical protein